MKTNQAYWISPKNEILVVDDIHINSIVEHPEWFGLTAEELNKRGIQRGKEDETRNQLMMELIKKGFIRVRYYPKYDYFNFQLHAPHGELSETQKQQIESFVDIILNDELIGDDNAGKYSPATEITIMDLNQNLLVSGLDHLSLEGVLNFKLYDEQKIIELTMNPRPRIKLEQKVWSD